MAWGPFLTSPLAHRGEICPIGEMSTPSFTSRGEHSLVFRRMEGWTENFTPRGQLHPWGQSLPLGAKLRMGLWTTNQSFGSWWSQMSELNFCQPCAELTFAERKKIISAVLIHAWKSMSAMLSIYSKIFFSGAFTPSCENWNTKHIWVHQFNSLKRTNSKPTKLQSLYFN
jgi:hypothetical protein